MSFDVLLHPKAKEFLKKKDQELKERIKDKIRELESYPEKRGKPLKHSKFWSLRVGDYRVIYEVKKVENEVLVLFIGHRENVYSDFSKLW